MNSVPDQGGCDAFGVLSTFRADCLACMTGRAEALFELSDAVLCTPGPVTSLVELSLSPQFQRGHGALYDALNAGQIDIDRLRQAVALQMLPRDRDGRILLAVDVSPWLRPDADTVTGRSFCHVSRRGKGRDQMIPGWPYSFVAALTSGPTSWTRILDAVRLTPTCDPTQVTADQLRTLMARLRRAGQWQPGDPPIIVCLDAGYPAARLAWLLRDLPLTLVVRVRSNQVYHRRPTPKPRRWGGRPPRHGARLDCDQPATHHDPSVTTHTDTTRYGPACATAFNAVHQKLQRHHAWADHPGDLPIIEGTLIRLAVQRAPRQPRLTPIWLWTNTCDLTPDQVDRIWRAYLRRFDLEHTFRFLKQILGWTVPRLRDPDAADRWTWLIIIAYTQLFLARTLTTDLRRPWQRPLPPAN